MGLGRLNERVLTFLITLLITILGATAIANAAAGDGFVLTQWGRWTHEDGIAAIDQAKRVGAKNITLLVELCQPSATSSQIDYCYSPRGEPLVTSFQGLRLLRLIPEIKRRGMNFSLIPFLKAEGVTQRQWIDPNNHRTWFNNYTSKLVEMAVLAETYHAHALIVGSELTTLFMDEDGWRSVIQNVRNAYSGHVTISAFFLQYPAIQFWDALDSIGVSAYFPLSASNSFTSVDVLSAAWAVHKSHLLSFASLHGKKLYFVEVGYPNIDISATQPWNYDLSLHRTDHAQASRCWEAFRRTWGHERNLYAFHIWGLNHNETSPKGFNPIRKRAEHVIKRLFRQRRAIR